jgi:hypothetical protein
MKLVSTETSLVIAGAWNPAILTPPWLLKHALGKNSDENNLVQAFLPAMQGVIFEFPRYVLEELSYLVRPDTLIMSPVDSSHQHMNTLEDVAAKILEELKHTPITGIGHNFSFSDTNPQSQVLDVFTVSRQDLTDNMPEGWTPETCMLSANFKNTNETVIVNIQRQFNANELIVKFNFHHPIKSEADAIAILKGSNDYKRMADNLELAEQLIEQLYGDIDNG